MTTETLNDIAASHFFFFTEATKAFCEMWDAIGDISSKRFEEASQRFNLAVKRANQEKEKLGGLV